MNVKLNKEEVKLYKLNLTMNFEDEQSREAAKEALETLFLMRKAGITNLNWALQFRTGCTSPQNSHGVKKVGIEKVKKAYRWFDKEFAKDFLK